MITIRNYKKVESLEEAWQLNQSRANRILGGMLWLKMSSRPINTAIDLSGLELDTIEETEDEFKIGAMVSLRQLELDNGLATYTNGAMKEAVRHIVGVQFRNLATVGGSIFGRYGFSDVLTMFMAMDSFVELYKGGIIPIEEFASMKYDNDILVRVIVKKTKAKFIYQSVRNTQTDFPVLTCATSYDENDNNYRFVIGARPSRAIVVEDKENKLTQPITEEKINEFGAYISEQIPTGSNMRGSAEYRKHLASVLVKRAINQLGGSKQC